VTGSGNSRRQFLKLSAAAAASVTLSFPAGPVVGLIVPSSNGLAPPDARTLYPTGVQFLAEGIGLGRTLPEDFDRVIERVIPVANELSKAGVGAVVLMSPSVSFYKGAAFNQRLASDHGEHRHRRRTPSRTSARRVAVATVYTDEISLHLQGFLGQAGFEVVTVTGLGIERFEERPRVTESVTSGELLDFCVKVREPAGGGRDADLLRLSADARTRCAARKALSGPGCERISARYSRRSAACSAEWAGAGIWNAARPLRRFRPWGERGGRSLAATSLGAESSVGASAGPITNRPQVTNLPHFQQHRQRFLESLARAAFN
jgi:hypothetical protein